MKKVPVYFFIALATILFGYAVPVKNDSFPATEEGHEAITAASVFGDISGLSAEYINKAIEVKWETHTGTDNKQFEIQRSTDGETFKTVGLVFTVEDMDGLKKYAFRDNLKGVEKKKLYYRIKQISIDENYCFSDIVTTALQKKDI